MEDRAKKWIFIEKSSETVRYKKVGDSDSSMDDCQDYEYLPTQDTPCPSTFEFIPSKIDELPASCDELEIHDNHFSSCPTSEMEDSDIEVVIKSPSSSETASLCSFNSQKSIPDATLPYDELLFNSQKTVPNDSLLPCEETLFNVDIPEKLNLQTVETVVDCDNEEEDSEVEVISRSIHRNGSIEISYVADINNLETSLNASISSGSENENEDEPEETISSKCIPPLLLEEEQVELVEELVEEENEEEAEEDLPSYDKEEGGDKVESIEDYGIKYLLEDIHVSRQINGRLVGLKTSTLALTVCLSITLGVYLGNYLNPTDHGYLLDNSDALLVPDEVHSTSEDPPRVNITFKYSSSTRESLKSILNSFRKLKSDYDRLHVAYAEIKDRCSRKKQMSFYWRKQAKQGLAEHEHDNISYHHIAKTIHPTATVLNIPKQKSCYNNNYTAQSQQNTIHKLSRDLINVRKSARYWRKKYKDFELSRVNTCSRYDDPKTSSFSFSDCFNIFSKVIPSLDIGVINITNRAENLADHVQSAWTRLSSRWNAKRVQKDDPHYLRKVNRFRRIFIISNVVNSGHQFRHGKNAEFHKNETVDYLQPDVDMTLSEKAGLDNMTETSCEEYEGESIASIDGDSPNNLNATYNYRDTNRGRGNPQKDSNISYNAETNWYKSKFRESAFLFNVYKWKNIFKDEIDVVRSQHISHLINENERQSKTIEELRKKEKKNFIFQEKVKINVERMALTHKKLKKLVVNERKRCNSSIDDVRTELKQTCGSFVEGVKKNVKKSEKSKYDTRIRVMFANVWKKYDVSMKKLRKVIRKEEKKKFVKKLNVMKDSLERKRKKDKKKLKMKYKNKKLKLKKKMKKKRHHIKYGNSSINVRSSKAHPDTRWNEFGPLTERAYKNYENNRKLGYTNRRNKNKSSGKFYFHGKNRRSENYARRYKQSVKEVNKLRKVYEEAVQKTKFQEEVIEDYRHQMERYEEIIREYERKMNEINERDKQQKQEILHMAERMKNYEKKSHENLRPMRSIITMPSVGHDADSDHATEKGSAPKNEERTIMIAGPMDGEGSIKITGPISEDESITISGPIDENEFFVELKRKVNAENDVDSMNTSETQKDFVSLMSGGECYRDPERKPFYNIEDVYPSDLFNRNVDVRAPSPPKTAILLPSPPLISDEPKDWYIANKPHREETFFDASFFDPNFMFVGSNESQIHNEETSLSWDNSGEKKNENSRNENSVPNKWCFDETQEESEEEMGPTLGPEAPKREKRRDDTGNGETNWFLRAMKGREEIRSSHYDISWFWRYMKEREKMRSSEEGDMNWFIKSMKEREKLRASVTQDNWFLNAMREREKLREGKDDVY